MHQLSVSLDFPDDRHSEFRRIPGLFDRMAEVLPLPLVGIDTLAGVPHAVPSARSGAERIRDLVLSECRVR